MEHRLAVWRTVEPHAHDRRRGPFGSDTPGERLAERSCAHAVTSKPAIPVSVRERAASRHRPRVCACSSLKPGADPQRWRAMRHARLVDLLQEALLQSAEESRLRQLRRGSARRQHEQRNARDRQNEGAAPSSHDGAVLPHRTDWTFSAQSAPAGSRRAQPAHRSTGTQSATHPARHTRKRWRLPARTSQ
jgi:hypothetical protein